MPNNFNIAGKIYNGKGLKRNKIYVCVKVKGDPCAVCDLCEGGVCYRRYWLNYDTSKCIGPITVKEITKEGVV